MRLTRLWLTDFRSYRQLDLELSTGLTAVCGPNGVGKTNLVEAIGLLATLKSVRGAPIASLIRRGADAAVVRAEGIRDDREVLIELELTGGRTRAQVNRQRLQRSRDLLGALRVSWFAPDDLVLLKGGPQYRREYLDDVLVALDPAVHALLAEIERIVRQRNALLRQARGTLDASAALTLDVWDAKLADRGQALTERREALVDALVPLVADGYATVAGMAVPVTLGYERSWPADDLAAALDANRADDVRRSVTGVGPHRDELVITLDGLAARTEASQGEQRALALALRTAAHRLVTDRLGEPPLLLLDDVLSELDPVRAAALLANLPTGQTVITSATGLPDRSVADTELWLDAGGVLRPGPAGASEATPGA